MDKAFEESTRPLPRGNNDTFWEFTILPPPKIATNDNECLYSGVSTEQQIHHKLKTFLNEVSKVRETLHENNMTMGEQVSHLLERQSEIPSIEERGKKKQSGNGKTSTDSDDDDDDRCMNNNELLIQEIRQEIEKLTILNSKVAKKLKHEKSSVKLKRAESKSLKNVSGQKEDEIRKDKIYFNEENSQLENMLHKYQQHFHSWEKEETNDQSIIYHTIQIRNLNSKIDRLTAELYEARETVAAKAKIIKHLRFENQTLRLEQENMPNLLTQVEIYKTEFMNEHESNKKMMEEKQQAERQVYQLEARCKQLSEELSENYLSGIKNQISEYPSIPQSTRMSFEQQSKKNELTRKSSSNGGAIQKTNILRFLRCPKCSMGFTDDELLLKHLKGCIENFF